MGQLDQYSTDAEGLSALVNTLGLMIAFVLQVYVSSIVLALGAVGASLHAHKHVTAISLPGDEPPTVPDDETEPAPISLPSS